MQDDRLGKYEIRATLGRGAMGTVYDGWDPIIARRVAIKTIRLPDATDAEAAEELARFKREAQAAGRLTHPNIVGVFDYGETADIAYIVMEFVDGTSLKQLLEKQERFATPEVVRVMEELLAGLQFSHDRGVVHRDIKPANVMITGKGQVKIADFGIARIESSSMTQAGTVLGTPAYMSPEQFMGQTVDARTDIYSSGVVLYQLLTGERPFEGSMTAIMHKALNTEPPKPSALSVTAPAGMDAVVARAMAKRPEQRFASASEFAAAIRTALTAAPPAAAPPAAPEDADATLVVAPRPVAAPAPARPVTPAAVGPASASGSRLPLLIGAAVVGLAVIGGGAWLALRPGAAPPAKVETAPSPTSLAALPPTALPPPDTSPPPVTPPAIAPALPASPPATPQVAAANPTTPATTTPTPATLPATPLPPTPSPPTPSPPAPSPPPAQPPAGASTISPAPTSPATPPSPPATPPTQLALAKPALALPALLAAVHGVPCARVAVNAKDPERLVLTGLAAAAVEPALREAVGANAPGAGMDLRIRRITGPYCDAIDALRAIKGPDAYAVALALKDGSGPLRDGDKIQLRLTTPDFPAHLVVDYLSNDGSLVHLYPPAGAPARSFAPGSTVALGEPDAKAGFTGWEVGPPYGSDLVIAIASATPLFAQPRPADEPAATYLRDLQAAVDAAVRRNARLSGRALILDTAAR